MTHYIFDFNPCASEFLMIDSRNFNNLAHYGASCWDVILGIILTEWTNEFA